MLTTPSRFRAKTSPVLHDTRHHNPYHKPLGRTTTPVRPHTFALRVLAFLVEETTDIEQSSHSLRYVMKNRATDEPLFVIIFTLLPVDSEGKPIMDAPEDDDELD